MPSIKSNKLQRYDDATYLLWYKKAQTKLKKKIADNLGARAIITTQTVNQVMHYIYNDSASVVALSPQSDTAFPVFVTPSSLIDTALNKLNAKVDAWQGVNVQVMNEPPKAFKKYWTTSDNWWNRYKAIWIGDYFFYPLLHDVLYPYITQVTKTSDNILNDLLYFGVLKEILHAKVTFNRARAQPLILDQAFQKADYLHQFFQCLGHKHNVEWKIPPNDYNHKSRLHVRRYAQQWVKDILKQKHEAYTSHIIQMPKASVPAIDLASDTVLDQNTKQETIHFVDNHRDNNSNSLQQTQDICYMYMTPNNANPTNMCTMVSNTSCNRYDAHNVHNSTFGSNSTTTSHATYIPQPYRPFRKRNVSTNEMRSHPYHVAPSSYNNPHHSNVFAYNLRNYNPSTRNHVNNNNNNIQMPQYNNAQIPQYNNTKIPQYNNYNNCNVGSAYSSSGCCNYSSNHQLQHEQRMLPIIESSMSSMSSMQQQLTNDSSMDTESRDFSRSSVSIVDQDSLSFGPHEINMEFSEFASFDDNDFEFFNFDHQDLSDLDYQYL